MSLFKRIQNWWRRQHEPIVFTVNDTSTHVCPCCNAEYEGNYCPVCGQRKGGRRITWSTVTQGVMDLWGMGTRSMPYTLWQLMLRPGYLVGEYLNGRRQVSFPPIKMLVFVGLFAFLVISVIAPEFFEASSDADNSAASTRAAEVFSDTMDSMMTHLDYLSLSFLSLLILPTWIVFRRSPKCTLHSIPEGFFLQVFISIQLIIVMLLILIVWFPLPSNYFFDNLGGLLFMFGFLFTIVRNYTGVFGYSLPATLWRLAVVVVLGFLLFVILLNLFSVGFALLDGEWNRIARSLVNRILPALIVASLLLALTNYLNRRAEARREQKVPVEQNATE